MPHRSRPSATSAGRLRRIRHVALDMDGTLYSGSRLFPCTRPFLALLKQLGIGWTFLTNNSSKSVSEYIAKLHGMGVKANEAQFFTSTHATVDYLRETLPQAQRLFVLGTAALQSELRAAGFRMTADRADDEPDIVIAGFDTSLRFSRLCRAAWWIKQGKPYIATHPDRICPTNEPTVLVDCGAICAAIYEATGRRPDAIPGKPDPRMLRGLLQRHGLAPDELAMVGDRLYTDVVMAHRTGTLSVLVLSGEATATEAAVFRPAPDIVVPDAGKFGELLTASRRSGKS